jgi:catechol 2,3-dioxygenase-like lactoylglutathione lyase family enzyme
MIKTFGLTHIALPVKNVKKSFLFYEKVFGVREMYRYPDFIQAQTPGSRDIIVFEREKRPSSRLKKGFHFGFRLSKPSNMEKVISTIKEAGGKIRESGEFIPGEPYVFFYDLDGYEVEIWFEKIPASHKSFN